MGPRRRGRAADRLAQALANGDAPGELRSLLACGPIGNPSFDHAETRPYAVVEEEIAPEPEDDAIDEPDEIEAFEEPAPDEPEPQRAVVQASRGSVWIVAAAVVAIGLGLGALTTAAVTSTMRSADPASTLLGGLTFAAVEEERSPLSQQTESAPESELESELVILLEEDRRRRGKARRAKRGARPKRAPEAVELVDEAASALEAGDRADAIDLFERAITADPKASAAAAGLSVAYFDQGRFDLATAWAERAVKTDFENPEYHVLLGDAYYRNAALDDARSQWETAAKLGSNRARDRLAKLD